MSWWIPNTIYDLIAVLALVAAYLAMRAINNLAQHYLDDLNDRIASSEKLKDTDNERSGGES